MRDAADFYAATVSSDGDVRVSRVTTGQWTELAGGRVRTDGTTWHALEATAEGSTIRVAWDGQPVLATSDTTYRTGYVGFLTQTPADTAFDNFEAIAE